MSQQPEPPASIAKALLAAEYRSAGMGEEAEPLGELYTPEGCALVRAQAVWDALLAHSERWQRIGRAFYDDTDEGQPVLVIPLPVVEPRDTEHA